MQENLLQFIWQYSLYRPAGLVTTSSEPVTVLKPGILNLDSGPDFSHARIQIADTVLAGAVEIHLRSSDWHRHHHSADAAYKNVVLHVVFEDDAPGVAGAIPVLQLQDAIAPDVLNRYASLIKNEAALPCAHQHQQVPEIVKTAWLARMLSERWDTRFADWQERLTQLRGDWQALFYERFCAAMGFKINAEGFTQLARSLPLNLLLRHRENLFIIEAILFGQSGLLPEKPADDYTQKLAAEYHFWQKKYQLQPLPSSHVWKFLRTRHSNFPTVRIAQIAAVLHHLGDNLLRLLEAQTAKESAALLQVLVSDYWVSHSRFDSPETGRIQHAQLGKTSAEMLVLNVVAPMRYLMALHTGKEAETEQALRFPETLKPEDNNIIRVFKAAGWMPETAADSQAMLTLFQQYCSQRRCLHCAVGLRLLRTTTIE